MTPGTRPARRVWRAAPFPAPLRNSALKFWTSDIDLLLSCPCGVASRGASPRVLASTGGSDLETPAFFAAEAASIEQAGDRPLHANPADRLREQRGDCQLAHGLR